MKQLGGVKAKVTHCPNIEAKNDVSQKNGYVMKGHSPYWAKIEDMRAIKGNGWRRGIGRL